MKVLYDHQIFSLQRYGGITRYFCEIIKETAPPNEFTLGLSFSDNFYLQKYSEFFQKINIVPDGDFRGKYFLSKRIYEFNELCSKYYLSLNKHDLFHPTFYNNYFLKYNRRPYVITVHDLINFKFDIPPFFKHKDIRSQMQKVINNANRIITISENTKKDIIDVLDINENKIDVIYHGYDKPATNLKTPGSGNYILFVGGRDGYKNFTTCLRAISAILTKESDLNLICVGDRFNNEELQLIRRLKVEKQVTSVRVDDEALNTLYANARLFIFPSLYEGFGMPILEAFMNNCPVCLSNASCFPEIAGNAAVYFDPESIDSIRDAISRIIYNPDLACKMIVAGKNQLENFSWEKAASQTLRSYEMAL